jgi:hypothetical protein
MKKTILNVLLFLLLAALPLTLISCGEDADKENEATETETETTAEVDDEEGWSPAWRP